MQIRGSFLVLSRQISIETARLLLDKMRMVGSESLLRLSEVIAALTIG